MFYKIDVTTRRVTRFALVALLAIAAQPALAASPDDRDPAVRFVSTQDLNLGQPSGQRMLQHRLKVAARKVCHEVVAGEPTSGGAFDTCYTDALADAQGTAATMIAAAERLAPVQLTENRP